MRVEKIDLVDFRNWDSLDLLFKNEGLTFIIGDNAQGKTNLLEAIFFGVRHKSFRSSERLPLIRDGAEQSIVRLDVLSRERRRTVASELNRFGRDRILINGKAGARLNTLVYDFPVSVFQPDDLSIIKDGPSYRRSYIDEVIQSVDATYGQICSQYERVLRQRNNLLRSFSKNRSSSDLLTLDVWDEKISDLGELITRRRTEGLEELMVYFLKAYRQISGDQKNLGLHYSKSWKSSMLTSLKEARTEDIRRQSTGIGPHRDDIIIDLDGFHSRNSISQGEQRTLAVVLKLASATMIEQVTGERPVVILDDIVSELDAKRVDRLLSSLPNGQIFISGTFLPDNLGNVSTLEVYQGSIRAAQ
jgi:DNA replication and repair protein RecF